MGLLIRDMEMPKEGFVEILIRDDGTVQQTGKSYRIDGTDYYTPYVGEMPKMFTAVPVLLHGRLIDADELKKSVLKWLHPDPCGKEEREYPFETDICVSMIMEIDDAPTIIPA